MFEDFSNLIFIAVAAAIFIGRTVAQARKRREAAEKKENAPPPPSPSPRPRVQTLHFEEKDDDYVPGYLKKSPPAAKTAKSAAKKPSLAAKAAPVVRDTTPPVPANLDKLFPARALRSGGDLPEQGFAFNLDHLSPLKQAIVMAEILGPPKGLNMGAGER